MTALYDGVGYGIGIANKITTSGTKLFVVVTDGGENSSKEWNHNNLHEAIDKLKNDGWEFLFLAQDLSTIQDAASFGLASMDVTVQYDTFVDGATQAVYAATSAYSTTLRSGGTTHESIVAQAAVISSVAGLKKTQL